MRTAYECIAAVIAAIVIVGMLTLIFPPKKARAAEETAAVRLTGEPCRLGEEVVNLPFRATWDEPDKHFEGCWGRHQRSPSVFLTYWEDRTVIAIPVEEVAPASARPALSI